MLPSQLVCSSSELANSSMLHRLLLAIGALVAVQGRVHSVVPSGPAIVAHRSTLRQPPENRRRTTPVSIDAILTDIRLNWEWR